MSFVRVVVAVAFLALIASPTNAKERGYQVGTSKPNRISLDHTLPSEYQALFARYVPGDTTVLGEWDFDTGGFPDPQGWTTVDITKNPEHYFHVDNFAGLGGGDFGRLVALEGAQSMWCGARPGAGPELCNYASLPGYGHDWNQGFRMVDCENVVGDVTVECLVAWDTEPGYDYVYVEWDQCDDNWTPIDPPHRLDGVGNTFSTFTVLGADHDGQVRLRFRVTSDGVVDDQDGVWNSDGAVVIDSLTVRDNSGVIVPTETFEAEAVGDTVTVSGNWAAINPTPFGDYSGIFNGLTVVQEDPGLTNFGFLWGFFNGSTDTYECGGFPLQPAVPYGTGVGGIAIQNEIRSPKVELTAPGGEYNLEFDVYTDLQTQDLVFYTWRVRSWVGGCAGQWRNRGIIYRGEFKRWNHVVWPIGDLVEPGASHIEMALGVIDVCPTHCGIFGVPCHSHTPLFDNVRLFSVETEGPVWTVDQAHLFQDNFASDGTVTGTVRADMAMNTQTFGTSIVPGDSMVVTVWSAPHGLAPDPNTGSGAAVYGYVSVWPGGPGKTGAEISDNPRWPVVDSLQHDGRWWYCVRMDSVPPLYPWDPPSNKFCLDLNDNLFTPGDTICFFFSATNNGNETSYWSEFTGQTTSLASVLDEPMEFTCLPAGGCARGGDILYVDGYDGYGTEAFFEWAFSQNGVHDEVDRYDIRAPESTVGNRPGSRVKNVTQQLLGCYKAIVWNTGDLAKGVIGDGTSSSDKSDDAIMLLEYLIQLPGNGGVYFSGDNIASELDGLSSLSTAGLRTYIRYDFITNDHQSLGGFFSSTLVMGQPGSCFENQLGVDTFWVYGGETPLAAFDVIRPSGPSTLEMAYNNDPLRGAVVAQQTTNAQANTAGVMMEGFSFERISNIHPNGDMDRHRHFRRVMNWLGVALPFPSPAPPASFRNTLAQNYPNPFNPTTTIEFTLRERSRVRLSIYNVAGQLVRRLVDDEKTPGVVHSIGWDGTNAAGTQVASGVYFYRLVAKDFVRTRKMLLLK